LKNIPISFYWEFSVHQEEIEDYRQLFLRNNGERVEGCAGEIENYSGDEMSEEEEVPNILFDCE
jgi:hypothetical protein